MDWKPLNGPFKRGGDLASSSDTNLADIKIPLREYWDKLFDVSMEYGKDKSHIKILVGIWLDCGSIITEIHDVREFARISYENIPLAKAYLDLPDVEDNLIDFIKEHGVLFKLISNKLKNTFDPKKFEELGKAKKGCTVIICNSDEEESEEVIFKS